MFKTLIPLGLVLIFRFFGLFVVLPVLSYYALDVEGATPFLVGIVTGGYALTQMVFQAPFGRLSDVIGRKKTLVFGMMIFIAGSLICFYSDDIYMLIAGRFLQGAGAVGAVIIAMAGDLVKEEDRSKAMAILGGGIALSFSLAMILGPILGSAYGVEVLFLIVAVLSFLAILLIVFKVPNPPEIEHSYNEKPKLSKILFNQNLMTMNVTNFLQKAIMTFSFVVIPIVMIKLYGWDKSDLFKVYIPGVILGVLSMGPAAVFAEKKMKAKEVLIVGVLFFIASFYFMSRGTEGFFIVGIILFFMGFNIHEPIMQSLVSKFARIHEKGLSLGISNSFGYFGTFLGGILGGSMIVKFSLDEILMFVVGVGILWIISIFTLKNPGKNKNIYLPLDKVIQNYKDSINTDEIIEWYVNTTENTLIIKYNEDKVNKEDLINRLQTN